MSKDGGIMRAAKTRLAIDAVFDLGYEIGKSATPEVPEPKVQVKDWHADPVIAKIHEAIKELWPDRVCFVGPLITWQDIKGAFYRVYPVIVREHQYLGSREKPADPPEYWGLRCTMLDVQVVSLPPEELSARLKEGLCGVGAIAIKEET